MPWIPLDFEDGIVEHVDPDPEGFTIRTDFIGTQEVLDQNTRVRNDQGREIGERFHYAATIPEEVQYIWDREFPEWRRDNKLLRRLLTDRDWCKVRTSEKM